MLIKSTICYLKRPVSDNGSGNGSKNGNGIRNLLKYIEKPVSPFHFGNERKRRKRRKRGSQVIDFTPFPRFPVSDPILHIGGYILNNIPYVGIIRKGGAR